MAGGHSDYDRGSMEISAQSGTFSGFMDGTIYGGSAIALIVIMPTLIFGVGLGWFMALMITAALGFVLGIALKLKPWWYVGVVIGSIIAAIACLLLTLLF